MKKRLTMLLAAVFLSIGISLAQNRVSGTVVEADSGEPIIGATISLKEGSKTGKA